MTGSRQPLQAGQRVIHAGVPEWGTGIVLQSEPSNRVLVEFNDGEKRKLDLNFAELREVNSAVAVGVFSLPLNLKKGE